MLLSLSPEERRRWRNRGLLAAAVVLVLVGFARFEHTRPLLLPIVLLTGAVVALGGLVLDAADFDSPDWDVVPDVDAFARGGDPGLASNVRLIENHLRSRTEDPVLLARLARLTDDRLRMLHLEGEDPQVRDGALGLMLGPTLGAVLDGRTRRLRLIEIEECVRRIEELS